MLGLGLGLHKLRKIGSYINSLLKSLFKRAEYYENELGTKEQLEYLKDIDLLERASIVLTPTAYSEEILHTVKPEDHLSEEKVVNGNFEELGEELVINGDFSDGSLGWLFNLEWTISNGKATCNGEQSSISNISPSVDIEVESGKYYEVSFDILDYQQGEIRPKLGNTGYGEWYSSNGTINTVIKAEATNYTNLQFTTDADFIGSIDNISVKQIDPNDTWELGYRWSIEDGKLISNNTTPSYDAFQLNVWEAGLKYIISYNVTDYVSGTAMIGSGYNTSNDIISSNGSYSFLFTPTNSNLNIQGNNFIGSIDNISVKRVISADFGFTRGSGATRVNEHGVVEDSINNLPRINYKNFEYENGEVVPDSGKASVLLEPQSSNLVTYSEDFTQWVGTYLSITPNYGIAPNNKKVSSLIDFGGSGKFIQLFTSLALNDDYSGFIYVKGTVGETILFGAGGSENLHVLKGEWQKISASGDNSGVSKIAISTFGGSTASVVELWGAQQEQLSYPTSYIPTEGVAVTRLADECINGGDVSLINSESGVLSLICSALADDLTVRECYLTDALGNNKITLRYTGVSNQIEAECLVNSSVEASITHVLADITNESEISFSYEQNNFKLVVDGVVVGSLVSGNVPSANTLTKVDFNNFNANVKQLVVLKDANDINDLIS